MQSRKWIVLSAALLAAGACDDDDSTPPGDGGTRVDATTSPDSSSTADGQATADAAALVTIAGIVGTEGDSGGDLPIEGATVSILDANPPVQTTTDAQGAFSLQAPDGTLVFLLAQKDAFIGGLTGLRVPPTGVSDLELGLLAPAEADAVLGELGSDTRDAQKGLVAVEFTGESGSGGEKVTLSATAGGSFTFQSDQSAVASDALVAGGDPVVVFYNVAVGTTTVTVTTATGVCNADLGSSQAFPVRANAITFVAVTCAR
jgi:hypothetical protein